MASISRIKQLAAMITKHTETVENFLEANNLPKPSLDADALWSVPIPEKELQAKEAQRSVIEACSELEALMIGPKKLLHIPYTAHVSTKIVLRFKLDQSFPVGESTTFEAMSKYSGINTMNVRRVVRHAIMNHRLFQEKTSGIITHSALTAVLAGDRLVRNALVVELDEFWPAGVQAADAMEKWPNSEENNETGFALANNSDKSMYEIFTESPERADRFGMYFSKADEPPHLLLDNYPWAEKTSMVDVGGSHGSIAISIAEKFPAIKCTVQDFPDTVSEGAARLPSSLRGRVDFMAHDFFAEQKVRADVYYFRSIFHNWADKYCIKILQKLIPALDPGARVIIHQRILPSLETLSYTDARRETNMDLGMLQLLNGQQREIHEWPELFRRADPRYHYVGAYQPKGAIRWIIEAEWQG
ncbi:MAG: hypothetical protein M1820_005972 [Bogoriella megaspora]|nr:MAG: hypothetical protein M1820_005972 [Bogoriella megaspora]